MEIVPGFLGIPDLLLPANTIGYGESFHSSPYGYFAMVLAQTDDGAHDTLFWWDGEFWNHAPTAIDDINLLAQDDYGTPTFAPVIPRPFDENQVVVDDAPQSQIAAPPLAPLRPFEPVSIDMGILAVHHDNALLLF